MHLLGGMFLITMMVITLFDVFTRGLFSRRNGAVDLTILVAIELGEIQLLLPVLFISSALC